MNKRQLKKKKKKEEMFIASWAFSYRELKKLTRDYHEYVVSIKRQKWDEYWINQLADAWNDVPEKYITTIEDWKRLGYTDEEAKYLVESSYIYI